LIRAGWIPHERLAALPLEHAWDDDNPFRVVRSSDDGVARRAGRLAPRARIALQLACAEWVLARFAGACGEPAPWQYLEARWAALADPRFAVLRDEVLDDDDGPVRGPIALALLGVTDAFRARDAGDPGFAAALARHVLGAGTGFEGWLDASLERLAKRRDAGAIARESFGAELSRDEESRLVRRFVRGLDASKNRFLVPTRH